MEEKGTSPKPKALCWDCANATGGCSWSQEFIPVEGWEAQENEQGIRVTRCPKFVRDAKCGGEKRLWEDAKMTEAEYNAVEGVRRSDLWRMEESPEKYRYFLENPQEPTAAMIFGAACHKYMLEPRDFFKEYAVAPAVDRRTKAGKEEYDRFLKENEGKTVVTQDEFATMVEMEKALLRNPLASSLIRGKGKTETPFFWTDPETGEQCKAKTDRIVELNGETVVVDYKTAASAQTDRFSAEVFRLGYHLQAAMYTDGVMACGKAEERPEFVFVAQEKKPPYAVNVIQVTEDVMRAGEWKFRELIGKLHECRELDVWPGYCGIGNEMNETRLPGWYGTDEEEE